MVAFLIPPVLHEVIGSLTENSKFLEHAITGRGNNADRPYDDRGEGITSTQKVGNFFCCNLIWEGPKLPKKMTPPSSNL
jgi:hypothetical protein